MKKKIILSMASLLFCSSLAYSATESMSCRAGRCDDVTGTYETENGLTRFMFLNNTDKPLYNVQVIIVTYDYFDTPLRRTPINFKTPMPPHEGLFHMGKLLKDVSKVGFEIYAADEFQGK